MKTQRKLLMILGVATMVSLGGIAIVARAETGGHGFVPARFAGRLAELGFTEEQKAKVRNVLRAHRDTLEPLVKEYIVERRALHDAIHASPVNEGAIRAQAAKLAMVEVNLAVQRASIAQDLRGVFTAEQSKKLQELKHDAEGAIDRALERFGKRSQKQ